MNQRDLVISYKRAFGSEEGKLVLEDLKSRFLCIDRPFSKTERESAQREGQYSVVCWIERNVKIPIEQLDELLKEDDEQ